MRRAGYNHSPLLDLGPDGFNEIRQGVMMSGFTWDCDVSVLVHAAAIKTAFPKNHSTQQCVSFVERNLDAFRGMVNSKLVSENSADEHGYSGRDGYLVEIDFADLERSRRWLLP